MAELRRVLRVGGRLALIWNARERGTSWIDQVWSVMEHVQFGTHEDVVDRIRSVSYVAALPPLDQQAVLGEIRAILREHPETANRATVGIPYRVGAMYTERLR
jgi:hypothetical protein